MDFEVYSHRHGLTLMKSDPVFLPLWEEIQEIIESISEEDIIKLHSSKYLKKNKSISTALNNLFKQRFLAHGWYGESYIFNDVRYINKAWRLDFAKDRISLEVAFNHSGTIAWNLMKPVIASELNHVEKAIQTEIGIIICATDELKSKGGFDSAVGSYKQYIEHLKPLRVQLTVPLVIIGLKKPKYFEIRTYKKTSAKTLGKIYYLPSELKVKMLLKRRWKLSK